MKLLLERIKLRKGLFWLGFFFSFILFLNPPLELYFGNINEFWFSLEDIFPIILLCGIMAFLSVIIIGYILPKGIYPYFYIMLFGVIVASYIQGNFLNNDYGVLDGKEILWDQYASRGIIDILVWLFTLFIFFILFKKYKTSFIKKIRYIGFCVIVMQFSGLLFLIVNSPEKIKSDVIPSTEGLFTYSQEKNVVVLCLDAFDSNVFKLLLDEEPNIGEIFKDFTFYENTSGMYPTTKAAIPHILTGVPYKNDVPYNEYLNKAYETSELYKVLSDSGYEWGLYGAIGISDNIMEKSTNCMANDLKVSSNKELGKMLYKSSLFKYVPQSIKPLLWMYSGEFDATKVNEGNGVAYNGYNFNFIDLLGKMSGEISSKKQFKFIHLLGMHVPYNMNENMEYTDEATYRSQGIGVCKMVNEYLNKLKGLNVYDDTCLIILADHGYAAFSSFCQAPIFLVKDFNEKGDALKVDSSALAYSSLQDILINAVEANNDVQAVVQKHKNDERFFLSYLWNNDWDEEYMPSMSELEIKGNVNDLENIVETGMVYSSNIPDIIFETPCSFVGNEAAFDYFVSGFWPSDDVSLWGRGRKSIIRGATDYQGDIYVSLKYMGSNGEQLLSISMEGEILSQGIIDGSGQIDFRIPSELLIKSGGVVELELENKDISDNSQISIRYSEIFFSQTPITYKEIILDQDLSFKKGIETANEYFIRGLATASDNLTWSVGKELAVAFHVEREDELFLKFSCAGVGWGQNKEPLKLIVYMKDKVLYEGTLSGPSIIAFSIPQDLIEDKNVELLFSFPNIVSPKDLKLSEDPRNLGIALTDMIVSYNEIS